MTAAGDGIRPYRLSCCHKIDPLGIGDASPFLGWSLQSGRRGARPRSLRVLAASAVDRLDQPDLWDSGSISAQAPWGISYGGLPLRSRLRVFWCVECTDDQGHTTRSDVAHWEMGLLDRNQWLAQWISQPVYPAGGLAALGRDRKLDEWTTHLHRNQFRRVGYLRKEFTVDRPVRRARLYATARGLFTARIDGLHVEDRAFAPGWTDYHQRIEYAVSDVTSSLTPGQHCLAVTLGEGWYSGYVGFRPKTLGAHYGITPWFLGQLEIEYADGSHQVIATGSDWQTSEGPIISSDLLMGETADLRLANDGWDRPGFDVGAWRPAELGYDVAAQLVAEKGPSIRVVKRLTPLSVEALGNEKYLVDFGQNLVGCVSMTFDEAAGRRIVLRHGEVLDQDGRLYTDNMRTARATDEVVSAGMGRVTYTPTFTFHGFRYCEIAGLSAPPAADDIAAHVIMSDTPETGAFACGNTMLNQLYSNIQWGQRGNFLSVPTDCPQRDERLGWTGDAQVFARTAALNMDAAAFFAKWLDDVVDAQRPDGAFTDVAPLIMFEREGAPGWGDAGIIIPWQMWRSTGDRGFIDTYWPSMERHIERVVRLNPDHIRVNGVGLNFGDWLSVEDTPRDLVATAYFARMADLMSRMASATARSAEARHYTGLFAAIRKAFAATYLGKQGMAVSDTQTAHALVIMFDLADEQGALLSGHRLHEKISDRGMKLSSGFLGTGLLLPALTRTGHGETAVSLALQEEFPSWGFTVKHGATTIWERWDSFTPEQGFQKEMNSFNHYAFGAIGEWMFEHLAGLRLEDHVAPLSQLIFEPILDARIGHCQASFQSRAGLFSSRWRVEADRAQIAIAIPPGTQAAVRFPAGASRDPAELDNALLTSVREGLVADLGSGQWRFALDLQGTP